MNHIVAKRNELRELLDKHMSHNEREAVLYLVEELLAMTVREVRRDAREARA